MSVPLSHEHLILRAEIKKPLTSIDAAIIFIQKLVDSIDMKIANLPDGAKNPIAWYCEDEGNRGLTSTAIIETSHIAMHIWDECVPAVLQLDVYSCAKIDPYKIKDSIEIFEPISIESKFIDRNEGVNVIF